MTGSLQWMPSLLSVRAMLALGLQENAESRVGQVPFVLILNKADLKAEWQIEVAAAERLRSAGWIVLETSAKSGDNVNEAFEGLGRRILGL